MTYGDWKENLLEAEIGSPEADGPLKLAHAIVKETCRDYLKAYNKGDTKKLALMDKYLRSDWFYVLGVENPDYIEEKIVKVGIRKRGIEGVSAVKNKNRGIV